MGRSEPSAPNWSKYDHAPVALVSHCCLLLMGLRPTQAIEAGVTKWPARSELGKRYNALLSACYKGMLAKNPLLQPLEGEVTKDRKKFQRLPLALAHFAALARSDLSPFTQILQEQLPQDYSCLRPPLPLGSRSSNDLLSDLRATYPIGEVQEDRVQLDTSADLENLGTRKDKQLALYTGILLHWVYETHSKQNWHWGAGLSASEIEADLLAWLRERAVVPADAPQEGTMRRYLGTATKAFKQEYRLKPAT